MLSITRRRRPVVYAALLAAGVVALAACSTGGKNAANQPSTSSAGHASTPRYTIAMITHAWRATALRRRSSPAASPSPA